MRENPVKTKLGRGEAQFGTMMFELFNPGVPAILAAAGADFVVYDMEHSGVTDDEIKRQIAYCRGLDLVPMVRPPAKQYNHVARLLDLGAMGFVFQMVESAEEAAEIVSWTRYPPGGVRGAMFGGAHDDYSPGDVAEKIQIADRRTLVAVLIETTAGLANVEEIMAVPGVDVGHVGHFDLSLTMGIPAQFDHPDFKAAITKIVTACQANDKPAGCLVPDIAWGKDWMAQGFRMISYSYDIGLLGDSLRAGIDGLKG